MKKRSIWVTLLAIAAAVGVLWLGFGVFFSARKYNVVSILIAVIACLPFFAIYERKQTRTTELILVATMTAISVTGRVICAPLQSFKPVAAITIITAMFFGPPAGFLTGSLSALISNLFFGQGPWTPFQMFSWGMVGFWGGVFGPLFRPKKPGWRIWLSIYGVIAGVMYSFLMDIWTTLSLEGTWSWTRYGALLISAIPVTISYSISNVVFLMLLTKPIGKKLARIKKKYGI